MARSISGSLRAASSNSALLRAMISLAPRGLELMVFSKLAEVPHFNPDLDIELGPPPVLHLRAELARSQAVVVSTPEYAHGVPGTLKNALDWVVRSGELYETTIALISPLYLCAGISRRNSQNHGGAHHRRSCVTLQSSGSLNSAKILATPQLSQPLRASIDTLLRTIAPRETDLG